MHFFAQGPLQAGFIAYLLQIDPDPRVMHPHFDSPLEALTTQTPTSPPPSLSTRFGRSWKVYKV
jgi:hypothetical protein